MTFVLSHTLIVLIILYRNIMRINSKLIILKLYIFKVYLNVIDYTNIIVMKIYFLKHISFVNCVCIAESNNFAGSCFYICFFHVFYFSPLPFRLKKIYRNIKTERCFTLFIVSVICSHYKFV